MPPLAPPCCVTEATASADCVIDEALSLLSWLTTASAVGWE